MKSSHHGQQWEFEAGEPLGLGGDYNARPVLTGLPPWQGASSDEKTSTALSEIADGMRDRQPRSRVGDNPSTPAGFAFLAQFVGHDLSFAPVIRGGKSRAPMLQLDSLYGQGPQLQPYLFERHNRARFLIGRTSAVKGESDPTLPLSLPNDLPRLGPLAGSPAATDKGVAKDAVISDPRNDGNLILAQLHLAFLKFHNAVVDFIGARHPDAWSLFAESRRLVTWHYQWVVLQDLLPRLVCPKVYNDVAGNGRHFLRGGNLSFVPTEFSAAAFRLCHFMLREDYDYNRVFNAGTLSPASLRLLLRHTGVSGDSVPIPSHWVVDWRRFFDFNSGEVPVNQCRRFLPALAPTLLDFAGLSLPRLDLAAGVEHQLPSGQRITRALDVEPLNPDELSSGPLGEIIARHGFHESTPLWLYLLREAEQHADGLHMGMVGSRIVAETLFTILDGDPTSFRTLAPEWRPQLPGRSRGDFTMVDLLNFAGDLNPIG